MKNITKAPAKGSLQQQAAQSGAALAESFLSVDVLIMVDCSGSMDSHDAPGGLSRFDAAERELCHLQETLPGKIGVIGFDSAAQFLPGGRPFKTGGSTNMVAALDMAFMADDTGIRFILISDGEPDDRGATLAAARRFKSRIDTVYTGPEAGSGAKFLQQLAAAAGGQSVTSAAPGLLAKEVRFLLTSQNP